MYDDPSLPPPAEDTWCRGLNRWQNELVRWGAQTICYAMGERAKALGKDLTVVRNTMLAGNEAMRLIHEMWDFANAQAVNPADDGEMTARMAHLVLNWTVEHLEGQPRGVGFALWKARRART